MDFQGWCGLQNEEKHAHHTTIHENITILLVLHRKKNGLYRNTTVRQILKTDRNQIAHIFWHTSVLFLATTMTLFHGLEL